MVVKGDPAPDAVNQDDVAPAFRTTRPNTALVSVARQSDDRRDKAQCRDIASYFSNNFDTLVNYGRRYRNSLLISLSRTDGCVDDIGNIRIGKSTA